MGMKKVLVVGLVDWISCGMVESLMPERLISCKVETKESGGRIMSFPLVFEGSGKLIAQATTKFKDLKKNWEEMNKIREFVSSGQLAISIWMSVVGEPEWDDDDRFTKIFSLTMEEYLKSESSKLWKIYSKKDKTFSDLIMMIYKRIFQWDEPKDRKIEEFGRRVVIEAEKMISEISKEEDGEIKKNKMNVWNKVKEYGEAMSNRFLWECIGDAERIVCNGCTRLCETLDETELTGLLAEGWAKKIFKEKKIGEEEAKEYVYLEWRVISVSLLLDGWEEKEDGKDIIGEIIKQIMMGKDGEKIDCEYVEEVSNAVRKRKKLKEECRQKTERELIRESDSGGSRKKREGMGDGEDIIGECEEKKELDEKLEKSVEEGVLSDPEPQKKGDLKEYKLDKRVRRWSKDALKIKEELDRGKEKKWRGRSMKEIVEQKEVHDIWEVVNVLRSCNGEKFFMEVEAGKDKKRSWKAGIGILERRGKKEMGTVEVGIFKNSLGENVVYHLMFRKMNVREVRGAIRSGVVEGEEVYKMLSEEEERSVEGEEEEGFMYPQGVRCLTKFWEEKVEILYEDPKNTKRVLRKLSIMRRPIAI
ncbi:DUF1609 domain-containing protein [Encephalitozoon intestinalis]|nr:DUF1609 domain-containing protein [Encephalitozoon intestinalis]